MKTNLFPFFILILLLISSLQWSCNDPVEPLLLATYTYSTNDRVNNLKPLATAFEQILQQEVEIKSYPDVSSFISGIKADQVDIALINTLGYLSLAQDNQHMDVVANLQLKSDAVDNYKTVLLTNNQNIPDLVSLQANHANHTMMFVAEGSTSGNLVPRLLLSSLGISSPDEQFAAVSYGGNHTSTLEKLLQGEADICAFGSNEYFKQLAADTILATKTKLLWISEEIPLGPVLLNHRISSDNQQLITDLLLDLHQSNPSVLESIKAGWSEAKQATQFQQITDSYYDSFRRVNGNETDLQRILDSFGK